MCDDMQAVWAQACRVAVMAALQARRALIKILIQLASVYAVVLQLHRDSVDLDVTKAFKKVVLKVHPDKGGRPEDAKKLNSAKD